METTKNKILNRNKNLQNRNKNQNQEHEKQLHLVRTAVKTCNVKCNTSKFEPQVSSMKFHTILRLVVEGGLNFKIYINLPEG